MYRIVDIRKINSLTTNRAYPLRWLYILYTLDHKSMCVDFMSHIYGQPPLCEGSHPNQPTSLSPAVPNSYQYHFAHQLSSKQQSTALRSFVFSSQQSVRSCPSFCWKVKAEKKQSWGEGLRHDVLWLLFEISRYYFMDRWGNISTKLTKMGTEVWPRRSGTRSSISQESRHQCKKKRA